MTDVNLVIKPLTKQEYVIHNQNEALHHLINNNTKSLLRLDLTRNVPE